LRPHSFEITFILDHIQFRSHSFYATLKRSYFDSLYHIFMTYLPLLSGKPDILQDVSSFEVLQGCDLAK